jgi:hypothetical protein
VYSQDGLTRDTEIETGSDNLLFAQNALGWLTPLAKPAGCTEGQVTILLWEGTFVQAGQMRLVRDFITRRGWTLKVTGPDTLAAELRCAGVLWYLSDWQPPADFATRHVPLIANFVRAGGGLLVGGLGWSYAQQGGPQGGDATTPYAADELGKPFGFRFTTDAFDSDRNKPITLLRGQ